MWRTYQGSCHCGQVGFEIDAELDHVRVCDCSICRRRGALLHRVERENFRLKTPLEAMSLYTFHTHAAREGRRDRGSRGRMAEARPAATDTV